MVRVVLAILIAASLSACAAEVKGPSAEIKVPILGSPSHFCPPGQAKKGNC
ncbi:MAG: hypothetical protein ACREJ5_23180 [Geminicoccaceae bacterium]